MQRWGEPLSVIRDRLTQKLSALPAEYKQIRDPSPYPIDISKPLIKLQQQTIHTVEEKEFGKT